MKARRGSRWRRQDARSRRRADRHARLVARLYDADKALADAPKPYAPDDMTWMALCFAKVRVRLAWETIAAQITDYDRARYVFRARGAGELYHGRPRHQPWPHYPMSEWVTEDGRRPVKRGRWRYVSLRRYLALDTSAMVQIQTASGPATDYVGLAPEDRCFRLRHPTRRHVRLDAWRRTVGLPTRIDVRWVRPADRLPTGRERRAAARRALASCGHLP